MQTQWHGLRCLPAACSQEAAGEGERERQGYRAAWSPHLHLMWAQPMDLSAVCMVTESL